MERQEVFDKVITHLLVQGKAAIGIRKDSGIPECQYRGPEGTMCAVGCLIPDELYSPSMEGVGIRGSDEVQEAIRNIGFSVGWTDSDESNPELDLLYDLQTMHDKDINSQKIGNEFREYILNKSKKIATKHALIWDYDPADWV